MSLKRHQIKNDNINPFLWECSYHIGVFLVKTGIWIIYGQITTCKKTCGYCYSTIQGHLCPVLHSMMLQMFFCFFFKWWQVRIVCRSVYHHDSFTTEECRMWFVMVFIKKCKVFVDQSLSWQQQMLLFNLYILFNINGVFADVLVEPFRRQS